MFDNDPFKGLEDLFGDPFALDQMAPEPLTYRDLAIIHVALEGFVALSQMTIEEDIPEKFGLPEGFSDIMRRVKVLSMAEGKKDPIGMLQTTIEILQHFNVGGSGGPR